MPLATIVRALASLKRDGLIARIGLCNVTVGQIEEARRIAEIDAVQVELSFWNDDNLLSGVAAHCVANGIRLLAHTPLGGPRRARRAKPDTLLADIAARHVSAARHRARQLMDLSNVIVPFPATRVETATALGRLRAIRLTDEDRGRLDERFPSGRLLRRAGPGTHPGPDPGPDPGTDPGTEVVLIMGLPGAGKSEAARTFVAKGYTRLNRDDAGGSLRGLLRGFRSCAVRRLAHRARQHLRVAQVAGGGHPVGSASGLARSLRLAAEPASRTRR